MPTEITLTFAIETGWDMSTQREGIVHMQDADYLRGIQPTFLFECGGELTSLFRSDCSSSSVRAVSPSSLRTPSASLSQREIFCDSSSFKGFGILRSLPITSN